MRWTNSNLMKMSSSTLAGSGTGVVAGIATSALLLAGPTRGLSMLLAGGAALAGTAVQFALVPSKKH